jgi:signal transduction histidine kinase
VKKIVTLEHHGEIRLASGVGEGTTITITIPVEQEF